MVQHVAGPLVLRPRYPRLGVFFHETDVTIVFWQAKHHRRATKFRSCLSLSHFSHIKVWCSQSKFHCHFSNVEKKTWRLAYFTPVVLPLELVLALANSRRSDDRAEGRFWTAILSRLQYHVVGHVTLTFRFCLLTDCYIGSWYVPCAPGFLLETGTWNTKDSNTISYIAIFKLWMWLLNFTWLLATPVWTCAQSPCMLGLCCNRVLTILKIADFTDAK